MVWTINCEQELSNCDKSEEVCILESEFNATLIAQIVDLLILITIVGGILTIISKALNFKKNINNKIETIESELKEIKSILKEKN